MHPIRSPEVTLAPKLRWWSVALAAALVLAATLVYAVRSDGSSSGFRTVVATIGDVEQTLSTGGLVNAANRADLSFSTDGTIASVKVSQGDRIRAGDVVAVLDRASLKASVAQAESTLARARAQLASDRKAQTNSVTSSSGTSKTPSPKKAKSPSAGGSGTKGGSTGGQDPALATLKTQQDAVLTAQSAASAAIAQSKDALTNQGQVCADASANPSGTSVECDQALATVQQRQDEVASAQDDLAKALNELSDTLTKLAAALSASAQASAASPQGNSAGQQSSSAAPQGGSSAPQGGSALPAGRTVTAATLASDQAEIDQARADLISAQQSLGAAKLTATRSGRVASVNSGTGDQVSAGDTVAVIVGGRSVTVTTAVTETQVGQVAVGQKVSVTAPGSSEATTGRVSSVSVVGDTSTGTATYPVTVLVDDPTISLPTGSRAMLNIVIKTVSDVVTVPLSAASGDGDERVVRVLNEGKSANKKIVLGAMGTTRVEVTDGLEAGTTVILADLGKTITDAASTVSNRSGFPNGGMPSFGGDTGGPGGMAGFGGAPPSMR
jgi:HlyD family secretion protein